MAHNTNNSLSQHKISDLISILSNIKNEHGDLNIIYWDQDMAVKFKNFDDAIILNNNSLLFGGFHNNGTEFIDLPK